MTNVIITHIKFTSKLKIGIFCFLLLKMFFVYAQQAPHYAQYFYNMQVLNPAFVGSKSDLNAALLTRRQLINIEGAPETSTFSVNTRINSGFGFGATVISDKVGLVDNTSLNFDVSYTIPTSEFGRLSFGVKSGVAFFNNDLASGITVDDEIYASTTGQYENLGFGFLYSSKDFYVGLSSQNLFESPVFRLQDDVQTVKGLERGNYFLTGGMSIELSKFSDVVFRPSTMIKYTPTLPVSVDINANFILNKKYEIGVSYRHQNSLSAMVSLIINKKYRIGYAYENYLSSIGQNLNSHELILRIDLKLERNKRWLNLDCCSF
jgi:type IX secretion system PorP/SprF family membrane protein